jgi:hypothetical protein
VTVAIIALAVALAAIVLALLARRRRPSVGTSTIDTPDEHTTMGADGAVRSVQAADLDLPADALEEIWTPRHLERLARTYWRYLSHVTLGLVRVKYTERERYVCLLFRPFVLLAFQAPEYQMDDERGIVRWRIERGVLVTRKGRGKGYLEIDIQRCPSEKPGRAQAHVEVAVSNFYPSIASRLSRFVYTNTQSRIHVLVTHGFLRSLARLDLAESRVGRFARIEDVPDPDRPRPSDRQQRAAV